MPFSLGMILALVASSAFAVASQTLFKQSTTILTLRGSTAGFIGRFLELLVVPQFLVALVFYGIAFVAWIWLLSKDSLSVLYPIGLSLNVVLGLLAAQHVLKESVSTIQALGIVVIIVGIFLVTRT